VKLSTAVIISSKHNGQEPPNVPIASEGAIDGGTNPLF